MLEIKGKYCKDCKIFAETIEEEALSTVYGICDHPAFKDSKIRIMSDVHQGKGIVIGFTCPVGEYVNPAHIGVDIGCQMTTIQLSKQIEEKDYPTFERRLRNKIPTGFEIQSKVIYPEKDLYKFLEKEYRKARSSWPEMIPAIDRVDERFITKLCQRVGIEERLFYKSIGTIGGGNHFLEYGETDDTRAFLTVHCGSRNFGLKVAKYWMSQAKRGDLSKELDKRIKEIKETVHDKTKWESLIKKAKEEVKQHNPEGYLEGEKLRGYLSDMVIAQGYAKYNHEIIMNLAKEILLGYGIHEISRIQTIHNYISFEDHIIRKGAIQSYSGRKMIIPFNMRDGLAICEGKSNQDWNFSAPHGAGRVMSRSAARENVDLEEFKETMKGIYSTCIGRGTLDESPMVYKDTSEIINAISDTAEILFFVKPRINIKAKDTTED